MEGLCGRADSGCWMVQMKDKKTRFLGCIASRVLSFVRAFITVCACVRMRSSVYACVYTHVSVCVPARARMCVYVCERMCVFVFAYVCVFA